MILLLLALVLVAVPVFLAVRWILVATRAAGHAEAVAAFLAFLPEPLRDPQRITWVSVAFALAAFGVAWFALRTVTAIVRLVAWTVVGVAGLLVMWNLFSLM